MSVMLEAQQESVSLKSATPLEKANHVLEKVIQYATGPNQTFLNEDGIFRQSGNSAKISEQIKKYEDPTMLSFDSPEMSDFIADANNVSGFLKRYLLEEKLWSDEAAAIFRAELQDTSEEKNCDFVKVINELIAKNHLEEAKMLHNVLYLAQLVSLRNNTNQMTLSNMLLVFAPSLLNMANLNPTNSADALVSVHVSSKIVNTKKLSIGNSFNQDHQQAAKLLDQRHFEKYHSRSIEEKPSIEDKPSMEEKPSIRKRAASLWQDAIDFSNNTAYPAVNNFLTKTLPNFFKRWSRAKAEKPEDPVTNKMSIHPALLAAQEQAAAARAEAAKAKAKAKAKAEAEAEAAKAKAEAEADKAKAEAEAAKVAQAAEAKKWQVGQGPKQAPVVVVGDKAANVGEPPLPADKSETTPNPDPRRVSILSPDEAEAAKQAREEGLKRFQQLESKATPPVRPAVPPRKILSQDEAEGAKQAAKDGLKRFQELEAKATIPPRPEVPPRKRPIVSPGDRPVVPPRAQRPALSKKDNKPEKPIPPPRENKPNKYKKAPRGAFSMLFSMLLKK